MADEIQVGDRVMLKGLTKTPELNGARGTLISFDDEVERWQVQLDDGKGSKHVWAVNVVRLPAARPKAARKEQGQPGPPAERAGAAGAAAEWGPGDSSSSKEQPRDTPQVFLLQQPGGKARYGVLCEDAKKWPFDCARSYVQCGLTMQSSRGSLDLIYRGQPTFPNDMVEVLDSPELGGNHYVMARVREGPCIGLEAFGLGSNKEVIGKALCIALLFCAKDAGRLAYAEPDVRDFLCTANVKKLPFEKARQWEAADWWQWDQDRRSWAWGSRSDQWQPSAWPAEDREQAWPAWSAGQEQTPERKQAPSTDSEDETGDDEGESWGAWETCQDGRGTSKRCRSRQTRPSAKKRPRPPPSPPPQHLLSKAIQFQ
mmetsp:Transcript_9487/g.26611  ORF Transcript_9487/g.26611 Transcript_9487/m.26611 type:complete len:371 (+) Transcript_9487:86-1198(+)